MSFQARANLWTVLRVVYDFGWFCPGKALKLGVLPVIVHRAPRKWLSLLLFAMLSGFFETDNSPSLVRRLETL